MSGVLLSTLHCLMYLIPTELCKADTLIILFSCNSLSLLLNSEDLPHALRKCIHSVLEYN